MFLPRPFALIAQSSLRRHATPRIVHSAYLRSYVASRQNHSGTSNSVKTCRSCSSPLPTALPACPKCNDITPIPDSMTYHEMFGVPYEPNPFLLDVGRLRQQFRAVQAVVHPDRWVSQPLERRVVAASWSSKVNEAYHQLSNPLRRAEYILAREGYAGQETDKLEDPEFLTEVMEAREDLAGADSRDEVAEIRERNQVDIQKVLEEIERLVETKNWQALRIAAIKLKYLQGIDSAAGAWPEIVHGH